MRTAHTLPTATQKRLKNIFCAAGILLAVISLIRILIDYSPFYDPVFRRAIFYYYLFSFMLYSALSVFIALSKRDFVLKSAVVVLVIVAIIMNVFVSVDHVDELLRYWRIG